MYLGRDSTTSLFRLYSLREPVFRMDGERHPSQLPYVHQEHAGSPSHVFSRSISYCPNQATAIVIKHKGKGVNKSEKKRYLGTNK